MDTRKIVLFAVSIVVMMIMVGAAAGFSQTVALPPAEDQVLDRLNRSPRHGAWVKDHARKMIRDLSWEEITRRLDATARYATSLPAATKNVGTVGFCWGGGTSFRYATEKPEMGAAVVYYGVSPGTTTLASIRAPTFRRNQAGQKGANMKAAEKAWPRMVRFLRETLGE